MPNNDNNFRIQPKVLAFNIYIFRVNCTEGYEGNSIEVVNHGLLYSVYCYCIDGCIYRFYYHFYSPRYGLYTAIHNN